MVLGKNNQHDSQHLFRMYSLLVDKTRVKHFYSNFILMAGGCDKHGY